MQAEHLGFHVHIQPRRPADRGVRPLAEAELLGIGLRTLYDKIKRYDLG